MTGPDHYREAERLLGQVNIPYGPTAEEKTQLAIEAQVHATLALAAATAIGGRGSEEQEWMNVAGARHSDGA
jgi:hypothetical protein